MSEIITFYTGSVKTMYLSLAERKIKAIEPLFKILLFLSQHFSSLKGMFGLVKKLRFPIIFLFMTSKRANFARACIILGNRYLLY